MRSRYHPRRFGVGAMTRRLLAVCSLILAGSTLPVAAETVLVDVAVGAGPVVVEMHRAEVHLFIDPDGENFVQVIDPQAQPAVDPSTLRSEQREGAWHVVRSEDAERPPGPPDVRVDIVLTPGTPITVRGHGLSVIVEDTAFVRRQVGSETEDGETEDGGTEDGTAPDVPVLRAGETARGAASPTRQESLVRLDVKASQVEVWGVADLAVVSEESDVRLEGTRDRLTLECKESQVVLVRHRGALQARGEGGETLVDDGRGSLNFDWRRGELTFEGGEGKLSAHLEGTSLATDSWRGDLALEGDNALIRVDDGRSSGRGLDVRGKDVDLQIGDWRGNLNLVLDGGRLGGGPWRGKLSVTAREGATVDLEPMFGELKLWLRRGARARLQGVTGALQADVESSELELEGTTRKLEFTGKEATASLSGAEHMRKLRATASTVTVDLASLKGSRPTIEALGGSRVRVDILAPCLVDINSPNAVNTSNLDISGCESKRLGVGRRGGRAPTRVDGAPMTRIVVRLSDDSSVEVEGR